MPAWSPWEQGSSARLSYDCGIRSWQAAFCVVQGIQADKAGWTGKRGVGIPLRLGDRDGTLGGGGRLLIMMVR